MNEHAEMTVAGIPLEIRTVAGSEAVSRLFEFVAVGGTDAIAAAGAHEWPGQDVALTLRDGHGNVRTVSGVAADVETEVQDDGTAIVRVRLLPHAHMASLGRECRYFLDKDVQQIVSEVLAAVPHRWELMKSYEKRAYTVQYREDDWTFARRLLEQEGIYFWFDHAAGSELVMGDDSTAADDLVGGAEIRFHPDTGMTASHEVVHAIGGKGQLTPSKFTVRSFDPMKPNLEVGGSSGGGGLEFYDAPGGGPSKPEEAARQASLRAKSAAAAAGVSGATGSVRVWPGRIMALSEHSTERFNARSFVTAAQIRVTQRMRDGDAGGASLEVGFSGIPAASPFVPPKSMPKAQQAGLQSGSVMGPAGSEIHPDDVGRVRVRMHWARQGGDGWWLRVAQRGVSDSLQLPRVGWNVLTFNDEGSVDTPSVLARILDAEHPPPYALPANKTRVVFKTHTSPADGLHNEIYFEDRKGEEQMFMHASKDMDVLVQQEKWESVEHDSSRKVGRDHRLTVQTTRGEQIRGNQSESIGNDERIEVSSSNGEVVVKDAVIRIGGSRHVDAGAAHSIAVDGQRTLSVGSALIDTSLGDIQGSAEIVTQLVGAAHINLAATAITQESGAVSLSAVGGLRMRVSGKNHAVDVEQHYVEAIGGLLMQKTKGKYVDAATDSASWTAGLAFEAKGKEISIKAEEKIELVCGDSVITLLPDKVEIGGKNLDVSKSSDIVIKTSKVEHN